MANGQQLDTDKIVESIRDRLGKRGQELSPEEIASAVPNGQGNLELVSLRNYSDTYNIRFTSHRPLLGWPIILAKKLLRKLLTPILERQIAYNSANTHMVATLWERSGVIGQQQGAALRALRTEMTKQQTTALQTLRTELSKQQETALRVLRTEMSEQQATALQTLRTEMSEQIEQMGQQRAAAFQAFREVVVGQVERLGQQHDTAMDTLRDMVVGQVEQMGQQQATAMDALRDMVAGQVEQMGQQQATAMDALRDMVAGQVEQMGQQQATAMDALRDMVAGQGDRLAQQLHDGFAERDTRIAQQKAQLIRQERRITMLLEEARKRLPEPFTEEALQVMRTEAEHSLDALYVSFEDQFRGTREDIKARCRVYLPLLKEAGLGTDERPILDLGCGRGEWLELLQEEGLQARGLDLNAVLVEECRERGLEVVEGDLSAYLRTLPDASVGMVTGFHIIEHLPFDILIALLDETVRVLQPGGLAIFETPNPQNVLVGSCNFYFDPTHRHPLPSQMMQFLAEARGLCNVEILYLHPPEHGQLRESTEVAQRFNEYFYGPMDYAIVGRRV